MDFDDDDDNKLNREYFCLAINGRKSLGFGWFGRDNNDCDDEFFVDRLVLDRERDDWERDRFLNIWKWVGISNNFEDTW